MDFNEITINDKALFDRYLLLHNPAASELTFTNLFMWRKLYKFRFTEAFGLLCIIAVPSDGRPYALKPIGEVQGNNLSKAVAELKKYFDANGWELVFKKVASNELTDFKALGVADESIVYDRDNSDYVYNTDDLVNLKGKKFHGKKNHINRFKKTYSYEYIGLEIPLIPECRRIMEEWCAERDCSCLRGDYCERYANLELLNHYEMLDCKGALVRVNGRFEAFTVGEMLNADTAVIHIEKALAGVDGIYTFINQQFCEHEWKHTTYVNREQDLGMEGLRKAKLSYNPVRLVDKYTIHMM